MLSQKAPSTACSTSRRAVALRECLGFGGAAARRIPRVVAAYQGQHTSTLARAPSTPAYIDSQTDGAPSAATSAAKQQRVFVFNPLSGGAEEMVVEPHVDSAMAEELLAAAAQEEDSSSSSGSSMMTMDGTGNGLMRTRSPIPLRAISPMPSRWNTPKSRMGMTPLPQRAAQGSALANANGNGSSLSAPTDRNSAQQAAKAAQMQRALVEQLEQQQNMVSSLMQYESQYKEWRVKAERLESDMGSLQRLVAEKDAELAHGYRLLEASAAERSRLRHSYQASQERAKALQGALAEAQAKVLQQGSGSNPALLGSGQSSSQQQNGNKASHSSSNGKPSSCSSSSNGNGSAAGVHNLMEELGALARGMARDMSQEVQSARTMHQQLQQRQQQ